MPQLIGVADTFPWAINESHSREPKWGRGSYHIKLPRWPYCEKYISNHPKLPGGCTSFLGVTKKRWDGQRFIHVWTHVWVSQYHTVIQPVTLRCGHYIHIYGVSVSNSQQHRLLLQHFYTPSEPKTENTQANLQLLPLHTQVYLRQSWLLINLK